MYALVRKQRISIFLVWEGAKDERRRFCSNIWSYTGHANVKCKRQKNEEFLTRLSLNHYEFLWNDRERLYDSQKGRTSNFRAQELYRKTLYNRSATVNLSSLLEWTSLWSKRRARHFRKKGEPVVSKPRKQERRCTVWQTNCKIWGEVNTSTIEYRHQ